MVFLFAFLRPDVVSEKGKDLFFFLEAFHISKQNFSNFSFTETILVTMLNRRCELAHFLRDAMEFRAHDTCFVMR